MTFASLASQGSPSPTHRAATVSRGPGEVCGGVTWRLCVRRSYQTKPCPWSVLRGSPAPCMCASPQSSSRWQQRSGLGGGFESARARVGRPAAKLPGGWEGAVAL